MYLKNSKNIEIDLPTGTGKTLIANLLTWLWLEENPKARVLYIVPRRILVDQHRDFARWMAPHILSLALSETVIRNTFHLRAMVNAHRVIISTPLLIHNLLRSGAIPIEKKRKFLLL